MRPFQYVYWMLVWLFFGSCTWGQMSGVSRLNPTDSLLLVKYRNEVIRSQVSAEDSLMTNKEIEANWGNSRLDQGEMKYAPDGSFKISTFVFESCGAYCNSEWYSWIHFKVNGKERVKKADFYTVDTIYQLPEKRYLVVGSHGHRPAGVLTVQCVTPQLISFLGDSLTVHPIEYKTQKTGKRSFACCQENGVDIEQEPYVKYDAKTERLRYQYANNYAYSHNIDVDTIRQGQFVYSRGYFILEKETIQVLDRRSQLTQTHQWTENYKIRSSDTTNIHIGLINKRQLVYDCIGCASSYAMAIKVFILLKGGKKELLTLPTNGAYLEDIKLLNIRGNHFIYIVTNETSGNSDGYLYYLNPKALKAYPVKVQRSKAALPKGCTPWGSYAYLTINSDVSDISTHTQFINTSNSKRGGVTTKYKLLKISSNQFVLKPSKRTVFEDE
ncbi:MAG: hypothetical protein CFE24_10175 [Flavobacterium sp. BFFFF2]|nr:MAG: hypothetical protein CFE24_10175 [Flavobacterium sp. BFFFF2]